MCGDHMLCADIINRRLTERGRRRMTIKQYYFIAVFSKYKQVKDILGNHCSTFVLITVRYMGLHIKILHKDKEHRSSSTPNKQQNLEHDDFSVELNNTLR